MFRAILITLCLATPALADYPPPPRFHKGGATVAKYHATSVKQPKQPKQPKPAPSIRYVTRTYHVSK